METIRPLRHDDIPSVAQLFQKIFRNTTLPASPSLISYFEEIYLNNPWRDEKYNSLVYESEDKISGFLGAIPFPMIVNGKQIQAVIGGNYMIDTEHPNPLAGIKILKTLFAGPQDVTYSDTATKTAQAIWEGLGGTSIHLYSLQWMKVFRPTQFGITMETRNTMLSPVASLLKPISFAIDSLLAAIPQTPFYIKKIPLYAEVLSVAGLFAAIKRFSLNSMCVPAYTEQTLTWLIKKAEEKKEFGPLKKIAFFNREKQLQGWCLYYPNRGKLGQVLQIGANRKTIDSILDHIFTDAKREGSLALVGRFEPNFIHEFSSHQCLFLHRNSSFVAFSRNNDILNTFHRGDPFFTRLEGEWWTRLQGDKF